MEKNIKDLLLRSVTEPLSKEEDVQLQEVLRQSPSLRKELDQLLHTQDLVQNAQPEADPSFSDRVMSRLHKKKKEVALVVQLFPRVAAACAVVVLALGLFLYFEAGNLSTEVLMGLEDLSPEEAVALTEY